MFANLAVCGTHPQAFVRLRCDNAFVIKIMAGTYKNRTLDVNVYRVKHHFMKKSFISPPEG